MGRYATSAKVVDVQKRRAPSKHYVYVIEVTYSEGSTLYIYRRYSMFFDLHVNLLEEFPKAAGADGAKRIIPYLPGKKLFARSQTHLVAQARAPLISEYVSALVKLPKEISQCERVVNFFEPSTTDLQPPKVNQETGKEEAKKANKKRNTVSEAEVSDVLLLDQYVAIADYKKQNKGEISLRAGMLVEIVEKQNTGWWFANAEGNQGWVPATFLEPVDTETTGDGIEKVPESKAKHVSMQAYTAQEPDEVSFGKAAVVFVREKRLDGWWKIEYGDQFGWAPGSYLKPLAVQEYKPVILAGGAGAAASNGPSKAAPAPPSKPQAPARPVAAGETPAGPQAPPKRRSVIDTKDSASVLAMVVESKKNRQAADVVTAAAKAGGDARARKGSVDDVDIKESQFHVTKAAFTKQDDTGISFPAGAKVEVMEGDTGSGWTYILYNGEEGWAPSDFLEPVKTAKASKPAPAPPVPAVPAKPTAPSKPVKPEPQKEPDNPTSRKPSAASRKPSVTVAIAPDAASGTSKAFKNVLEQAQEKMSAKKAPGPSLPAKPKPPKPGKPEPPLPPLPPPESGTHVAVSTYRAETDVEVSLTEGMEVTAGETADGWTMVTTSSGAEGWVPSEFIKPAGGGDSAAAPPRPAKPQVATTAPGKPAKPPVPAAPAKPAKPAQPKAAKPAPVIPSKPKAAAAAPPVPAKPSSTTDKYRCIGAFVAETEQELSMKEGEVCTCSEPAVDGWLFVTMGNRSGYVPQDFLMRV